MTWLLDVDSDLIDKGIAFEFLRKKDSIALYGAKSVVILGRKGVLSRWTRYMIIK